MKIKIKWKVDRVNSAEPKLCDIDIRFTPPLDISCSLMHEHLFENLYKDEDRISRGHSCCYGKDCYPNSGNTIEFIRLWDVRISKINRIVQKTIKYINNIKQSKLYLDYTENQRRAKELEKIKGEVDINFI